MNPEVDRLEKIALTCRQDILKMALKAGGAHIAPAFSIVEILVVLYFSNILKHKSDEPNWIERDRLILSKGHSCAALYAILAEAGFFSKVLLDKFCQQGSKFGGHPNMLEIPGVEASTGSLGHGLAYGIGQAMAAKMDHLDYNIFVILGDGECQEGSIWEAALVASQNKLGRIIGIVDYNKLQGMDFLDNITSMEPFFDKWKSFGWDVCEVDGHCISSLYNVLCHSRESEGSPLLVIAHTIKGKGISFMENEAIWHYRLPNKEELEVACKQLEIPYQEVE